MIITGRTRVFALLGDPVDHSLSPRMHNAGFAAAGIDAVYVALRPSAEHLAAQMAALIRNDGGGNVTVPYKVAAAAVAANRDELVDRIGSANVFGSSNGGLHVGNTDVQAIASLAGELAPGSSHWLILGTGGSARGAVAAASLSGSSVSVQSRTSQRAAEFAEWARTLGVPAGVGPALLVINATPLGRNAGDALPIDPAALPPSTSVLDLNYQLVGSTPLVSACMARGLRAMDGREVLLAQGIASWRFWFDANTAPPTEVMRAAVYGRLG